VPLTVDGKIVGAVGVSGGSGEQDQAVAVPQRRSASEFFAIVNIGAACSRPRLSLHGFPAASFAFDPLLGLKLARARNGYKWMARPDLAPRVVDCVSVEHQRVVIIVLLWQTVCGGHQPESIDSGRHSRLVDGFDIPFPNTDQDQGSGKGE
jgi:Haem degrading protein HbpS-like